MTSIGDLQVDLRLASAKFEQGFKDVTARLDRFEKQAAKAELAAKAVASVFAINSFSGWIKGSIDAADAAAKTSQSIGITVEALTGLQFAADLAGVSSKNLDTGLKNLNKSIYDAYKGAASQSEAFKILGVSVTDANGNLKDSNSVLLEVADRFANFADGADKTALSMQLFGKSGKDMIPLLNGGTSSITELTDRAKKLGVVISDETAAASEHFNDNLSLLAAIAQGSGNSLATQLLPALNDITDAMITFSENSAAATTASNALGGALKVLLATGTVVADSFMVAGEIIGASAAAISAAAQGEFDLASRIFNDTTLGDKLKSDGEAIRKLFDGSADATKSAAAAAKEATDAEASHIAAMLEAAKADAARRAEAEKTLLAIQKTVDTLRLESDVIGMTANEVTLYKLALEGATQAQLDSVATSQFIIQSHKDRVTALDELIKAEDAYNQNKASAQSGLDSTTAGLQTAGESIDAQYTARLAAINQARTFELETAISYDELEIRAALDRESQLTELERQAAEARMAVAERESQAKIGAMQSLFGGLSSLMNTGSKKLFDIGKKAAVAKSIIDGYTAVQNALASVPYPFNLVAAAGIAVQTGTNVASIRAQQFGGGGSVSAAGGAPNVYRPPQPTVPNQSASTTANTTPVTPRERITIINQTTGKITSATETQISPTERAILLEEAESRVASSILNPNSMLSRNLSASTSAQRVR